MDSGLSKENKALEEEIKKWITSKVPTLNPKKTLQEQLVDGVILCS
jgi:hypothetical protein